MSAYCFTSRKESWYPSVHSICNFLELKLFLQRGLRPFRLVQKIQKIPPFDQEIKITKTGIFFHVILFLTNKQGDRNHSVVNQSKTIIKQIMLIQLKVTQNHKKNMLKRNNLTSFIHLVKKRR